MDRTVEEIALEPLMTQNQDNEALNKRKLRSKSDNIQKPRKKRDVLIRIFNSKKYLKHYVLWIVLFVCLMVIAGPLSLHISYSLPQVKSRNISADVFSEERARDYLINLTRYGSRVSNTRGNFDARNFLLSQMQRIYSMRKRKLRFEINLQNFTDSNNNQLQNILVRVSNPITKSKNVSSLLLTAHYDSVEFSPGSSDDGSGVVILLELFSNLINDRSVSFSNVNLIILLTDGEEMGPQSAIAFINNHPWRFNIRRFIYIDAISCSEKASLIQIKSSQLIIDYSRVLRPSANVILENIPEWIGTTSDYDIYSSNASLFGYNFGNFLDGYTYHTALDQSLFIKEGVLQELGEDLGILIRHILLKEIQEIDNDRLIYFDIFGRYLIIYKMSTSRIIQIILIILIIIISIILILLDKKYHHHQRCLDSRCIYFYFQYSFILRILSIIIYFLSNIISVFVGLLFSMIIAWIISITRPLSWFGNSTLTIYLFSLPCSIGFIIVGYLWNIFHGFILKKWPKTSPIDVKNLNKICFDFEQNLSILLVYVVLMFVSIFFDKQIFYLILVWSIFVCPMYLLLMIIQFLIHWKQIQWRFYGLYFPLIICLFPLAHTIEIMTRLIRIFIPFMSRDFYAGSSLRGNLIICNLIAVPNIFFVLIFIPILQRTKEFGRVLIVLFIAFLIILIIVYNRQPFTNIHPKIFYAKHTSKSIYGVTKLTNVSFNASLVSQSSSITFLTFDNLPLSPVLDHFSAKSGHILHNKICYRPTICTFDDAFNRTFAVQHIGVKSMENFLNYTIVIRHVLSYNIEVSSFSSNKFLVRNQLIIPRTETIIDITLNSTLSLFFININIKRCDLIDSPFLLLFTHLMPHMLLTGSGQCQAINDVTTLVIDPEYIN